MSYLLIISLLFLSEFFFNVNGEGPASYHQTNIKQFVPRDTCSSYEESSTNNRLTVVHSHGPCSPATANPSENQLSYEDILDNDLIRVKYLHHKNNPTATSQVKRLHPSLSSSNIPANRGISYRTANYIVTLGFGTPKKDQTLIFDTGSDVTWIQCQPCVWYCYDQTDTIFDPSQSSTFSYISCTSPYCSQLNIHGCNSTCLYGVQYGDDSYTIGFYSQDTLTVTAKDVIPKFRFGCGERNDGLFGQAAGLLGLGRRKQSFVSQSYQNYGGVFSYCLPANSSSTGYLTFGSGVSRTNVKFTPLLSVAQAPTFYYLNLLSISVGGKKLSIPSTVFSKSGTIIDSGTVITRLPPMAYSALRAAFQQAMSVYKSAPALSILDTCYDLSGVTDLGVPTVTLNFQGGAAMNLDVFGILYVANVSQACLGFAANSEDSDLSIIGNTQQRRLNVVYDVAKKVVGFGPGDC